MADRLQELFNTMRSDYESKWDDLKIFIQYGILTDEKFAEKAPDFMLWKNVEGKYFTPKEYTEKVKEAQTDKNKTVVFLYVDDPEEKYTSLEAARPRVTTCCGWTDSSTATTSTGMSRRTRIRASCGWTATSSTS